MDKTSRAIRRHHRARMQRKAVRILQSFWRPDPNWVKWSAPRWRDNLQKCSCASCGNQRNAWWGDECTLAELRSEDSMEDQLVDYYLGLDDNTDEVN